MGGNGKAGRVVGLNPGPGSIRVAFDPRFKVKNILNLKLYLGTIKTCTLAFQPKFI